MKAELIFPTDVLIEYAKQVVDHWPDPTKGTYSEKAAWLCLDTVCMFSYALEAAGYFETLEELYYYIQNPNKFCLEYKQFYAACKAFVETHAMLKISEAIINDE